MIRQRHWSSSLAVILFLLLFQSCYSSTAVKGIPIKDLPVSEEQKLYRRAPSKDELKAIASLSRSRGNKTFTEIRGIPEYRVGPLDKLEIISHVGDHVSSDTVTVDNRGRISYSFIDDMEVSGLTPSQIDSVLTEKLSAFIKNPRIDIIVKEFKSKSATILGELASLRATTGIAASGRIFLEGKTRLMDLIALAGGFTKEADIKNVKLVRRGRTYLINLYDILERADESQNVVIDNGDVVEIPKLPAFGERVFVMGEVNAQGIYSLEDAQDLLGAISLAGSFTPFAKEENTIIVRGYTRNEKGPLVIMSDINALLKKADLSQNITLEDGDLIYVPRMLIGDINDWVSNMTPLLNFLFYPKRFQDDYFTRNYLHINRK